MLMIVCIHQNSVFCSNIAISIFGLQSFTFELQNNWKILKQIWQIVSSMMGLENKVYSQAWSDDIVQELL